MELEDLKKSWDELNGRLEQTEDKLRSLADKAMRERADSLRRKTENRLWLPIVAAGLLPLLMYNMCDIVAIELNAVCIVSLILFMITAVANGVSILIQLRDLNPLHSTVKDICCRTRRLRRHLLWGVVAKFGLMTVLVLSLSLCIYESNIAEVDYVMYGFWAGLAVGLPIGIHRFIQIYGDIAEMEHSFGGADDTDDGGEE